MSDWFKNIPCPNCRRLLRYSTNTASKSVICFGCKKEFVPNEIAGLGGANPFSDSTSGNQGLVDSTAPTLNDKSATRKWKKLPRWARVAPKPSAVFAGSASELGEEPDNANISWAIGEAQPYGAFDNAGSPHLIPLDFSQRSENRKTVVFGSSAFALLVLAFVVYIYWGSFIKMTGPTPSDPPPSEQVGPPAPTPSEQAGPPAPPPSEQAGPPAPPAPASGSVATILKHESEIFAIEEYVLASVTAANEKLRIPHIVVEVKGLKLTDKVRFSLECKKYPNLLNADKRTLNPEQLEGGDVQSAFDVRMPWNTTELTSPNNRDPMIEIQVEAFVNERSVINQTLKFHFNEIYVLPIDSFICAAAYVQPDHPQIKSLQGQYASMDLKWDWDGLEKSMDTYVQKEVSKEEKDPKKAEELFNEKCGEFEKSYRSMLRTYFVWKLVDSLQIKYQNLTKDDTSGLRPCQQLRTVDDVLKSRMGNCIEESILLASLMQDGASLMSPRGHCMVMVGLEFDFYDSIPLECTTLGASVNMKDYQEILSYAEHSHSQSGLGRLWSVLQVMPPKMKRDIESDPSWRNFASAIESGSEELSEVFDRCANIRAWSRAKGCIPPFPEASMTNNMSDLQKEQLCKDWSKQETEMLEWLSINDVNYKISQEAKASNDLISKGLAYWNTVCLLKQHGEFDLDNYVPISYARKIGIVALPNDLGSTPPKK